MRFKIDKNLNVVAAGMAAPVEPETVAVELCARFVDAGERRKLPGPEARMDFFFGFDVFGTHGHDLGAEGQEIPLLIQRENIAADELRLILADLDKMRLDGEAVIAAAVLPG